MTQRNKKRAYIPGVRNINPEEAATRRQAGNAGLFLFIISLGVLLTITDFVWPRVLLVIPAFLAAIGYLQAVNLFCIAYAAIGKHNAEPGSSELIDIHNKEDHEKDLAKAKRLKLQAFAIAVTATAICMWLPSIK